MRWRSSSNRTPSFLLQANGSRKDGSPTWIEDLPADKVQQSASLYSSVVVEESGPM